MPVHQDSARGAGLFDRIDDILLKYISCLHYFLKVIYENM